MAQILEFTHSIRTPFAIAADFNMEPDQLWETGWVQSLGQRQYCRAGSGDTCTTGRGQVIDFGVISDSVRPFWRGITPEYNSPCKPHIGICLQFTATPTQVRVRQACFPKSFAFPKTVEQVVPSRKRMKSKTKPEEPRRKEDTSWDPKCGFSVYWVFSYKNTRMRIGALFSGIHAECGGVRC